MSPWPALLLLYAYALFWGLRKGSVICVTVCAPGLVPYVADRKLSWREGLKVGVIFNIPRIALLTIVGAVVGAAGFIALGAAGVTSESGAGNAAEVAGTIGYILVGAILFAYGVYTLMMALEERQDIAEGKPPKCGQQSGPLPHSWLSLRAARLLGGGGQSGFLLVWGSVLGLACIGETLVALETALLSGVAATLVSTTALAALLGATMMLSFSLGAAVPVLLVTAAAGKLSSYLDAREKIATLKLASSVLMILVGLALLYVFALRLIIAG